MRNYINFLFLVTLLYPMTLLAEDINDDLKIEDYYFDESLLLGLPTSIDILSSFTKKEAIISGTYQVEVYLNNEYISKEIVRFESPHEDEGVKACFTDEIVSRLGILPNYLRKVEQVNDSCAPLNQYIDYAKVQFDFSRFRVDISIAQVYLKKYPQGYIPVENWDKGESMVFLNYQTNSFYYSSDNSMSHFVRLSSGFNANLWRFYHTGNITYNKSNQWQWNNVNYYTKRAIPSINSELTIGDSFTSSNLFNSINFKGVQLDYDQRMLPNSVSRYAPVIRGIAQTNAKVVVSQNGVVIYETTVTPGAFEINDLMAVGLHGDFMVTVQEADGKVYRYIVPYNSMPFALREGTYRYSIAMGKMNQRNVYHAKQRFFSEINYQYGLTNYITLNSSVRLSENYYSTWLGNVLNTPFGAFNLNGNYTYYKNNHQSISDWKFNSGYSRYFENTQTNTFLNFYFYSKNGDLELNNLTSDKLIQSPDKLTNNAYIKKYRLEASVNQPLGNYGQISLMGAYQSYYSKDENDLQFQLGYSNTWKKVNYSANFSRTYLPSVQKYENTFVLMFSLPFFWGSSNNIFSQSFIRQGKNGLGTQSNYSDSPLEDHTFNYNLNVSKSDNDQPFYYGGNIQKRFSVANIAASYSQIENQWSSSFSAQGALVAHRDGIVAGQYLSDTFALVAAPHAKGAMILNGQGIEINRFGYALIPAIAPYKLNEVVIDPGGLPTNINLIDSKKSVVPYAGTMVKVNFHTRLGYPILIYVDKNHHIIPIGSTVYDGKGNSIGLVGQGNQIYIQSELLQDVLMVKWGEKEKEQCKLAYSIEPQEGDIPLYRISSVCDFLVEQEE